VADDVAFDGEVADVDLDLPRDEEAVLRGGPLGVEVGELVDRGVEEGGRREGFLHGALDEAVGEAEAAGEGERLGEEGCGCFWGGHRWGRWGGGEVKGVGGRGGEFIFYFLVGIGRVGDWAYIHEAGRLLPPRAVFVTQC